MIQDVLAPPNVIMDKIKDIRNYPKVVPTVKKVDVYSQITHKNGIFLLTYLLTHLLTI